MDAYGAARSWHADVVHDHTIVGSLYSQRFDDLAAVTTNNGPFDSDLATLYRTVLGEVGVIAISADQASAARGMPTGAVIHHDVDVEGLPSGGGDGGYALFLVARVCTDASGSCLQIGVGKHDRLAKRMVWGDEPPPDAVAGGQPGAGGAAVRRPEPPAQPALPREVAARRLARRSVAGGFRRARPGGATRPLADLQVPLLAPGLARDPGRTSFLVACSVGFDPTFVPSPAELRAARAPDLPLVLVVPEGQANQLTSRAMERLRAAAEVRTVPGDWHEPSRLPDRGVRQPTP